MASLQGSSWQHDKVAFEAVAAASVSLAEAYLAASQAAVREGTGRERRELGAARLQLRGIIKQAQERFSGTPSYIGLEVCLAKVEEALSILS